MPAKQILKQVPRTELNRESLDFILYLIHSCASYIFVRRNALSVRTALMPSGYALAVSLRLHGVTWQQK